MYYKTVLAKPENSRFHYACGNYSNAGTTKWQLMNQYFMVRFVQACGIYQYNMHVLGHIVGPNPQTIYQGHGAHIEVMLPIAKYNTDIPWLDVWYTLLSLGQCPWGYIKQLIVKYLVGIIKTYFGCHETCWNGEDSWRGFCYLIWCSWEKMI